MHKLKKLSVYLALFLSLSGAAASGVLYYGAAAENAKCRYLGPDPGLRRQKLRYKHKLAGGPPPVRPAQGPSGPKRVQPLAWRINRSYLHLLSYLRYKTDPDKELSPVLPDSGVKYDEVVRFSLEKPDLLLTRSPRFYAYEIKNAGGKTAPGPIIYKKYLWNSFRGLLRTSGFGRIRGELDRAEAIYYFLLQNHVHDAPPLGNDAEYDAVTYLARYGYGLCDDAARVQTAIMQAAGLKARVWFLDGHVVPEVFADGKWRLFDPDHRIYFHAENERRNIYGVEDLASNRGRFDRYVSDLWGEKLPYPESNKDIFQTTANNTASQDSGSKNDVVLGYDLRRGEKIVFTNYNWGKFYAPDLRARPLKRYYNGYLEYQANVEELRAGKDMVVSGSGPELEIRNTSGNKTGDARLSFSAPFDIVGGIAGAVITKKTGAARLVVLNGKGWEELSFDLKEGGNTFNWSNTPQARQTSPVHAYTLGIKLAPGARIGISGLYARTEFQFGKLALLELLKGDNRFSAYFPERSGPGQFEGRAFLKY